MIPREAALAFHHQSDCFGSLDLETDQGCKHDFVLSHAQRNPHATTLVTGLDADMKERGCAAWLDVKMQERSKVAMEAGVKASRWVIAVITGPCLSLKPTSSLSTGPTTSSGRSESTRSHG